MADPVRHSEELLPLHSLNDDLLKGPPEMTRTFSDSSSPGTTASEEDSDFDWDKDDDAEEHQRIEAKRGRRLWLAFMRLSRLVRVFLIACIGVAIFVTPLIVVNVRFHDSTPRIQVHVWSLWLTITWAATCGTSVLVDGIPHLIIALTTAFAIRQVERMKIQIELFMAVRLYFKLALDITWAWVALSVIRAVYHPPGTYWKTINQVMQAFFSAAILLLFEKIILHSIAINFHQTALADRLAENKLALRALDHLSNATPAPTTKKSPYGRKFGKNPNGSSFDVWSRSSGKTLNNNSNVNQAPRPRTAKRMANVIVDQVGGAIAQVALKDSKFNKGVVDMSGIYSARRLARKLFSVLSSVEPPRAHLIVEDFFPYFRSTSEAHEAFAVFDKDGNGDITKREMREAVQRIYRERKNLVAGLKDVGSIVAKLDGVLFCVTAILIMFICLLIFKGDNTISSLVPLATIVLGFSFVFGNSAQTLFESLIFIFSTHVFDVGDLVLIDDQVLFVKEFGLFATTFRRVDGQEIIAPNSVLASTKLVHNLRRSRSMWETTNLVVSYSTSMELIEKLKSKISTYINDNSRDWSGFALNIDKMEYQNALHLVVAIEHRSNWQDWGGRWSRRNGFMRYLKTVLEELDIRYTMPVQPVIFPSSNGRPPVPQHASSGTLRSQFQAPHKDVLGNSGFFEATDFGRVSGAPSFPKGVPSFGGGGRVS